MEFGFEGADDVPGAAEAVLLAFEQVVVDADALGAQGLDHRFGLVRGHDAVLVALEEDDRAGEAVAGFERRALAVEVGPFGIGADESVEVARLELVGVAGEGGEIGDAVVAGAGGEGVPEGERGEGGVAAGAAAADEQLARVRLAAGGERLGGGGAVLDVDDAPAAAQRLAVGAAVAGAAAVVDVDDGEAARGPELDAGVVDVLGGGGGAAVALDDERRFGAGRGPGVVVLRRVEEGVGAALVGGWEVDGPAGGEIAGVRGWAGGGEDVQLGFGDVGGAGGGKAEADDFGGAVRGGGQEEDGGGGRAEPACGRRDSPAAFGGSGSEDPRTQWVAVERSQVIEV